MESLLGSLMKLLKRGFQLRHETFRSNWLYYIAGDPYFPRPLDEFFIREGRKHDNTDLVCGENMLGRFKAIHNGHLNVH